MPRPRGRSPAWASIALVALSLGLVLAEPRSLLAPLTLLAVALLLLGLHHHRQWPRRMRRAFGAAVLLAGVGFSIPTARIIAENVQDPPEWDYVGFWLHARTAVLGRNFYDPVHAQVLAAPFDPTEEFEAEILSVGFWYPPPSMFLFLPLGWFQPVAAMPVWLACQLALIPIVVVLSWRLFFPRGGPIDLIACATLVIVCHGTFTTFSFAQTNFAALLAVLLFWRRRNAASGGAWIAAACVVKPLLGLMAVEPLLGGRWRVIAGLAVSTAVLLAASALAFGAETFATYFTRDPVGDKPDWIYSQPTNQSLLGLVLRLTGDRCSGAGCLTHPIFLAGAGALTAVTVRLAIGLERARESEWAIALVLLLAMIVYPVSQLFYSVLHVPPALLAWRERERLRGGAWTAAVAIGTVFALGALHGGTATVYGTLLLWIIVAWVAVGRVRGGGRSATAIAGGTAGIA